MKSRSLIKYGGKDLVKNKGVPMESCREALFAGSAWVMDNEHKLTVFICDDHNSCTFASSSLWGWSKHCDAVVSVFIKTSQCGLTRWRSHNLSQCRAARQRSVGNCVTHYNTILIWKRDLPPADENTARACIMSSDIRRGGIWFY